MHFLHPILNTVTACCLGCRLLKLCQFKEFRTRQFVWFAGSNVGNTSLRFSIHYTGSRLLNASNTKFFFSLTYLTVNPPTIAEILWQVATVVKNHSTACFDCWPKCAHGHFWLVFTVMLTTLNNTRQCFHMYLSKIVDSFQPVNVLTYT